MRVPGSGVMCAVTSKHCSVQQPVQTSPAVVFACMCCCPRRRRRPFDLDGNARRRYLTHSFHCTSLPSCARQQGRRLALAPAVPPVVGTAHPKPAVLRRSGRGKGTIRVMRGVCKRWALALLAVAACAASAHAQQGNAVSVAGFGYIAAHGRARCQGPALPPPPPCLRQCKFMFGGCTATEKAVCLI